MSNKDHTALRDYIKVTKHTPPMFLAHAYEGSQKVSGRCAYRCFEFHEPD